MHLIRGLQNIRSEHRGCVATIGNFDGVHLGHQAVIGQLAEKAAQVELPTTVITFEPQPLEYFNAAGAPARLTRFREKMQALQRFNIQHVLCLPFNRILAEMSAPEFIRNVLVDGLAVKYLVVGDDFRFGKGREGDFAMLQQAGEEFGFQVVNMHSFIVDNERVSSTRIRNALQQGELDLAANMLGRSYRMSGRVAHGKKLGRELGFPTANIHMQRNISPLSGIFVVEVFGLDLDDLNIEKEPLQAVASLGTRPTVDGKKTILEVFIFDFDQDIYGAHLQVSFLHKLRDEVHYTSLEALKIQIEKDVEQTKEYFINLYNKN